MPGKSKDVAQQKIRDNKSSWNQDVSHFISKMIAFKRGINGRGDTKYNLPISKIQDPFAASIPQTLSQLTAEYEKLAKEAVAIISEQDNYSKTRKKRKEANLNYELEARAGRLSRFWSYVKSPFSNDDYKKHRITLLRSIAEIDSDLVSMQENLVSKNLSSIKKANSYFEKIDKKIKFVRLTINYLKEKQGPGLSEYTEKIMLLQNDFQFMKNIKDTNKTVVTQSMLQNFSTKMNEFFFFIKKTKEPSIEEAMPYIKDIYHSYEEVLKQSNRNNNTNNGSVEFYDSFEDMQPYVTEYESKSRNGRERDIRRPTVRSDEPGEAEEAEEAGEVEEDDTVPVPAPAPEPAQAPPTPVPAPHEPHAPPAGVPPDLFSKFTNCAQDFLNFFALITNKNINNALSVAIHRKLTAANTIKNLKNINEFIKKYEVGIDQLRINLKKPDINSFEDALNYTNTSKKAYERHDARIKIANVVSRWLKKKIHELSPFDKSSALRLDAFEKIEESRLIASDIMSDLEDDLDASSLDKDIEKLEKSFIGIKQVNELLMSYYNANESKDSVSPTSTPKSLSVYKK
jgi:hypothetical protein